MEVDNTDATVPMEVDDNDASSSDYYLQPVDFLNGVTNQLKSDKFKKDHIDKNKRCPMAVLAFAEVSMKSVPTDRASSSPCSVVTTRPEAKSVLFPTRRTLTSSLA